VVCVAGGSVYKIVNEPGVTSVSLCSAWYWLVALIQDVNPITQTALLCREVILFVLFNCRLAGGTMMNIRMAYNRNVSSGWPKSTCVPRDYGTDWEIEQSRNLSKGCTLEHLAEEKTLILVVSKMSGTTSLGLLDGERAELGGGLTYRALALNSFWCRHVDASCWY
jgi:hypothetical protein